jgi:hypothetical protein
MDGLCKCEDREISTAKLQMIFFLLNIFWALILRLIIAESIKIINASISIESTKGKGTEAVLILSKSEDTDK